MEKYPILEVCVDSLASARAAIQGGADRLELCAALAVGGLTPYTALLEQIRNESSIPVRCLMRPRGGDFLYTPEEIRMMAAQIRELRAAGADGFVIGCLTRDGNLDKEAMAPLVEAAAGAGLTLHRCIDVSRDPVEVYFDAKELGIDTILTSGAASNCTAGKEMIGKLIQAWKEHGGPRIMPGAGVNAKVITAFLNEFPELECFHASCKTEIESGMLFRRDGVPMGLPGLDEWHIQQTSAEAVAAAKAALTGGKSHEQ